MTVVEKEIRDKISTLDKSIEYLELVREVLFEQLDKELEKNGTVNSTSNS